jgi:hypothetical protein
MSPACIVIFAYATFLTPLPRALAEGVVPPIVWSFSTPDVYPPDVAPAPGGGAYVSVTDGNHVGAVLRLNGQGSQMWRQSVSGRAYTVASDSSGNAFLGGDIGNDAFLRKYSPTGALQWNASIASPVFDWPTGVGTDGAGNAYFASGPWAANYSVPPPGTFSTLRRFNPDGQLAWLASLDTHDGTYPGNGGYASNGTVVDHSGHVYSMFSNYNAPHTISGDAYLTKATLDGQLLWTKSLGNLSGLFSLGVDSSDNVYAAAGDLIKFDPDGNVLWTRSRTTESFESLAIGPRDEIFVAGGHRIGFAGYIAAYDTSGILEWYDTPPLPLNEVQAISGLTVSGNKLISAIHIARDGYWSESIIRAYQIPEASTAVLVGLSFCAAIIRWRNRPAIARRS